MINTIISFYHKTAVRAQNQRKKHLWSIISQKIG